jgi:hypothetical protein
MKKQPHKFAVMLMTEAEAVAAIPTDLMNLILAIELPGLARKEASKKMLKASLSSSAMSCSILACTRTHL